MTFKLLVKYWKKVEHLITRFTWFIRLTLLHICRWCIALLLFMIFISDSTKTNKRNYTKKLQNEYKFKFCCNQCIYAWIFLSPFSYFNIDNIRYFLFLNVNFKGLVKYWKKLDQYFSKIYLIYSPIPTHF